MCRGLLNNESSSDIFSVNGNINNNLNLKIENVIQIERNININIDSRINKIGKAFRNKPIDKAKLQKEIRRK